MKNKGRDIVKVLTLLLLLVVVNVLSGYFFKRFDLTKDKRFTLSEASEEIVSGVESPLLVDVFLEGEFPPEFRRLQQETRQLLEEFKAENPNIRYEFIDPLEESDDTEALRQQMNSFGLRAAQVEVKENGKLSSALVYPWALAYYRDQTVRIPLLKNQLGATTEERVNASLQNLEYAFSDGFGKLTRPKRKKVAVLKGNGQLQDRYVADFFSTLREYYFIAPFTLDSVAKSPLRTLELLSEYDLVVSAAPTLPFTDSEKYVLDQYLMQGGRALWLLDQTENRIDSISGNTFAFGRDLNLNDFFFKYGIRVNPDLVRDVYSAPIVLATGEDRESQYNRYPWFYNPLSSSRNDHPIVTNIEAVKFEYASSIDTLPNQVSKSVLLSSSPLTQLRGLPAEIDIDKEIPGNLKIVNEGPDPKVFSAGETPLAVLLEGQFTSAFANRVKPIILSGALDISEETKMVVISDGDVIRNQLDRGRPLELGFDKWTQSFYGNKEFLLNTVNYLLDDSGLINIRSKEIALAFLDPQKTASERATWQIVNILSPLALLGIFGILFRYIRKRRFG